jgi:hypothetical protein
MIVSGCDWSLFESRLFLHQPEVILRLSFHACLTTPNGEKGCTKLITSSMRTISNASCYLYIFEIVDTHFLLIPKLVQIFVVSASCRKCTIGALKSYMLIIM